MASGKKSLVKPEAGGAFQQSVLGPALLSVSINYLDDGAEWTFEGWQVALNWDERLGFQRVTLSAIQKDLSRNSMKLSKKCLASPAPGASYPSMCWGPPSWGVAQEKRAWGPAAHRVEQE